MERTRDSVVEVTRTVEVVGTAVGTAVWVKSVVTAEVVQLASAMVGSRMDQGGSKAPIKTEVG